MVHVLVASNTSKLNVPPRLLFIIVPGAPVPVAPVIEDFIFTTPPLLLFKVAAQPNVIPIGNDIVPELFIVANRIEVELKE